MSTNTESTTQLGVEHEPQGQDRDQEQNDDDCGFPRLVGYWVLDEFLCSKNWQVGHEFQYGGFTYRIVGYYGDQVETRAVE